MNYSLFSFAAVYDLNKISHSSTMLYVMEIMVLNMEKILFHFIKFKGVFVVLYLGKLYSSGSSYW